jgi:polyphosphate kinase
MNVKNTPEFFLNREISWLEFNERVMELSQSNKTPPLEKLKFCEIFINNLDEFFMKRVGGLKNQEESKHDFLSVDGKSPTQQLKEINKKVTEHNAEIAKTFNDLILPELKLYNIFIYKWSELSLADRKYLTEYFEINIFPILTPLGIDSGHPFPYISNLSKSLGISLVKKKKGKKGPNRQFVRVKIPSNISPWIKIPSKKSGELKFISIDEVIMNNIHRMFSDMKIEELVLFRITRNADFEKDDEDTEDLMEHVESAIKDRKFGPVVRVEHAVSGESWVLKFLCTQLEVNESDVYYVSDFRVTSKLSSIYSIEKPEIRYNNEQLEIEREYFENSKSIFWNIRRNDKLFHHPYDQFSETVQRFIVDAAHDPKVLAIKLTLYRIDQKSKIIDSLIYAAEKGKQVACVIELQARFDEENNILMAQKLEKVGIYVVYGMVGLKTHSKMALVVRKEKAGLRSYVHIATGNYNAITSKFYTDVSFFTSNKKITAEAHELFNILTGIHAKKKINNLLVAPLTMRKKFISLIQREIAHKKAKRPARIIAKMNSLEDIEIINQLYKASQAGVEIILIVRGFCCLRPGVPKLSENIKVYSVMGRFLEHSRIYFFQNGKNNPVESDYFIGSADWMYRNLNNRFEVIAPIAAEKNRKKLWHILEANIEDVISSWELAKNGKYHIRKSRLSEEKKLLTATQVRLMADIN